MARNEQVTRILRVIQLLEVHPAGLSVRELLQRLEHSGISCSLRSVYRDLEAIEQTYLPVTREGTGADSRWRLNSVASVTPSIHVSYRELMGLFVARHMLDSMKGSPVYDAIASVFSKMEKALGSKAQKGLKEFEGYLGFKASPMWQSGVAQEILDTVHQACAEGHLLEIEYRSVSGSNKGEIKVRKVGPHTIYFADSSAYLIAKDLHSGSLKTYSLNRVHSAVILDEPYDHHEVPPELFSAGIGVLSEGEAQEVVIDVVEPMASYIGERRWHESQTLVSTSNGIQLRMRVKINDELVRWILGLGAEATVIAPAALRERVEDMSVRVSQKYSRRTA